MTLPEFPRVLVDGIGFCTATHTVRGSVVEGLRFYVELLFETEGGGRTATAMMEIANGRPKLLRLPVDASRVPVSRWDKAFQDKLFEIREQARRAKDQEE